MPISGTGTNSGNMSLQVLLIKIVVFTASILNSKVYVFSLGLYFRCSLVTKNFRIEWL